MSLDPNNELYIGKLVWNRLRYIKDPDTGKRVSRLNPESQWIRTDVPELRIVDQDLWDRVKAEQGAIKKQHKEFWGKQRPRTLFSGLVKCGCCGGGMSKMSNDHLGCSTARNQGICDNLLTIRRDRLEETVLKALKTHLMDPDLCQAFCDAYTKHLNRLRMEHNAKLAGYRAEQAKLIRRSKQMVDAVAEGFRTPSLKKEMEENDARQQELEFLLSEQKESPVLYGAALSPGDTTAYQAVANPCTSTRSNGDDSWTDRQNRFNAQGGWQ